MDAMVLKEEVEDEEGTGKRQSTLSTAVRLLKAFSDEESEIGVSALSQKLGVAKSTIHRLAVTLVAEGLLEQNPENEKYRLGVTLFSLGALVRRRMDLSNEARPYLYELRDQTNETVILAILSDSDIMYVHNMESKQAIRMRLEVGVRKPAFCTAMGRAILAFQPDDIVRRALAGPLVPQTAKTLTDVDKLQRLLAQVKKQGFAIEDEESEAGMRCIAAPVRDASGAVVGAVGVAGPVQRLSMKAINGLSPALIEVTETISRRLGFHPGTSF